MYRRAARIFVPPRLIHRTARRASLFESRAYVQSPRYQPLEERTEALGNGELYKISMAVDVDYHHLKDHRQRILDSESSDEKRRHQNAFIWELARHAIAKELVIYPEIERHLPGGAEIVQKQRAQHRQVREQLQKFQSLAPEDANFNPTLDRLWRGLSKHIEESDSKQLAELDNKLSLHESKNLTRALERTKLFAPTKDRPRQIDEPPFVTANALMMAPLDKLRNLFEKFP